MDAIATKVMEVRDGHVKTYLGGYSDYLWKKEQERAAAAEAAQSPSFAREVDAAPASVSRGKSGPKTKEQKRREAVERARASGTKTDARKERRKVQDEIAASEKRLEEHRHRVARPVGPRRRQENEVARHRATGAQGEDRRAVREVGGAGGLSVP